MHTYIALFRGINVGGNNTLPMNQLVALLTDLGYQSVRTYIQSGNVVFTSNRKLGRPDAETASRKILEKAGFEPRILLLDKARFRQAIDNNPFPTENGKALHFFFCDTRPGKADLEKLNRLKSPSEQFKLAEDVFYLFAPDGIGRSKLAAAVEKAVGVPVTARNWNTVSKLSAMAEGD